MSSIIETNLNRQELTELLKGGFAPVVILLREFHPDKAGIVLPGLPYSAWSLLEHMKHRQQIFLKYINNPDDQVELWPKAYWPLNPIPDNHKIWYGSIDDFENDSSEMIKTIENPETLLTRTGASGKSVLWAATATLQHNAYHIGQIKAIGRQLGVW